MDSFDQLLSDIAGPGGFKSERHRLALRMAVASWTPELDFHEDQGRKELKHRVEGAYLSKLRRDKKGFVVAGFLLLTILAAAISWAVQRFLDWRFPNGRLDPSNQFRLSAFRSDAFRGA